MVAGLMLPSCTRWVNSFLLLRPIAANEYHLEALRTEKFCPRIGPILHCRLLGQCVTDATDLRFNDQSTPEYEGDVAERGPLYCDTIWKQLMAGSSAGKSRNWPNKEPSSQMPWNERWPTIAWKTFAIH
jgi:hypothetical protein